jgi:hypothetical protein
MDNLFAIHGGYVLDFSDRTIAQFFAVAGCAGEGNFAVDRSPDRRGRALDVALAGLIAERFATEPHTRLR